MTSTFSSETDALSELRSEMHFDGSGWKWEEGGEERGESGRWERGENGRWSGERGIIDFILFYFS
jgi:hypothetical protein